MKISTISPLANQGLKLHLFSVGGHRAQAHSHPTDKHSFDVLLLLLLYC